VILLIIENRIIATTLCMESGMGTLFNPLTSTPDQFDIELSGGQQLVRIKHSTLHAKFFTVGIILDFTVDATGSSFQIAPTNVGWGRSVALFGALFKENALYFTMYKKGLNFSTKKRQGKCTFKK
jgi:hypothetical protein